jgi:hypothetical protein
MQPTICRLCGGPIFSDVRVTENPNVCRVCGDWIAEDDIYGDLIFLLPHLKSGRGGEEPVTSPDSEAI